MFRYHYMEMIEKRISEIVPMGDGAIALGWNQFSSRLITVNIHHLTNRGARRHYVHFALALVSLVIGCVLLSLLLLLTVHDKWVRLLLPLAVVSALIYLLYCYFIATDYSRVTFEQILSLNANGASKEYREDGDGVSEDNRPGRYFSQFRGKFLRLLYTRPRDSMKSFFYLGGALLGTSLVGAILLENGSFGSSCLYLSLISVVTKRVISLMILGTLRKIGRTRRVRAEIGSHCSAAVMSGIP